MSGFFNRVEVERLPDVTIVHLIHDMEVECCMCGRSTFSKLCVPYYCGPVREGCSEGGYSHACECCYARWERWNDSGMARLYKPTHGGYPSVPCSVKACVAASPAPSDDWSVARDCPSCGRMATPGGPCQRTDGAHGVQEVPRG